MQATPARAVLAALLVAVCWTARAEEAQSNPLGKVLELIDDLTARITKEGEVEEKAFKEYFAWCDDVSKNARFDIKSGAADKEKLEAKIGKATGDIDGCTSKIDALATEIAKRSDELKKATEVRKHEAEDFAASEKQLVDAVDTLSRAIGIIEKGAGGGAALAQVDTSSVEAMVSALSTVLSAAAFPAEDQRTLTAFVQNQADEAEDEDLGAPSADAYKSKSGGILDLLNDLHDQADSKLSDLRKAEMTAKNNFQMLELSLKDQISADTKDFEEQKATKSATAETKAAAEGELEVTKKELAHTKEELDTAQSTCMTTAGDHDATVKAREEELKVIAEAKKILEETAGGAAEQSYSLVQVQATKHHQRSKVTTVVLRLAKKHHSASLSQLASKIDSLERFGASSGENPFGKIKTLIEEMLAKLKKEAEDEASEKEYCDSELAKTEAKKGDLEDDVDKMTVKVDQAAAKSGELKGQVKQLEAELAALAKEQGELDKIRRETHEEYLVAKADLEQGLGGVRKALNVLREYYASEDASASLIQDDDKKFGDFMQQPAMPQKHSKSSGGNSIIGILEVCESDFATSLSKQEMEEEDAQADYEKITQENKITTVMKESDVKYKTKKATSLDATIAEVSEDRETTNTELASVNDFWQKLQDRCIAKPDSYAQRKERREAEIAGLKEALTILEDETAFVQRKKRGGHLRGALEADDQ